jgi:hypothetical protein
MANAERDRPGALGMRPPGGPHAPPGDPREAPAETRLNQCGHCRRGGGEGIEGNASRIECTQAVSGNACGSFHMATIAAATIRARTQKVISIHSRRLRCMSVRYDRGGKRGARGRPGALGKVNPTDHPALQFG